MDNFLLQCIVGFFSAIIGSMGMGGGSVLLLYLTSILGMEQMKAQGINLTFFIPIAIISILVNSRNKLIRAKTAVPAIVAGAIGAWIGSFAAQYISSEILSKLFGFLVILIGIKQLYATLKKTERFSS